MKEQKHLLAEVVIEGVMSADENPKDVKENYTKKRMLSAFVRGTEEVGDGNNSWLWMKKGYSMKETERLIMAAQDHCKQDG